MDFSGYEIWLIPAFPYTYVFLFLFHEDSNSIKACANTLGKRTIPEVSARLDNRNAIFCCLEMLGNMYDDKVQNKLIINEFILLIHI